MRAGEAVHDLFDRFLGGRAAHRRLGAGAEPLGGGGAELDAAGEASAALRAADGKLREVLAEASAEKEQAQREHLKQTLGAVVDHAMAETERVNTRLNGILFSPGSGMG